jgi:hypothetical protein
MKLTKAKEIIEFGLKPPGFRVSFERKDNGLLFSDYFPDNEENPIDDVEEAKSLARRFATQTKGHIVNIRVMDLNHIPVPGFFIENR